MEADKYLQQINLDLGIQNFSEEEKLQILEMLSERFGQVVVKTLINNLNEEQKKEFETLLNSPEKVEEGVVKLSSVIPGLDTQIEQALYTEYEIIKAAMRE